MHGFAQDILAQERLQGFPIYNITRPAQQFSKIKFQADVLKHTDRPLRIQFNQDVNVALRALLPACDGSEYGGVLNPKAPQFIFMRLEGQQDFG